MAIEFQAFDDEFNILARKIQDRTGEKIFAFEVVCISGDGHKHYLDQLFSIVSEGRDLEKEQIVVREKGDMVEEVETKVVSLFDGGRESGDGVSAWVEIHDFDRRKAIEEASQICVNRLDKLIIEIETDPEHEDDQLIVALCTRRRHLGKLPYVQINHANLSRIERKISGSYFVGMADGDFTQEMVLSRIENDSIPREDLAYLARLTGGNPDLLVRVIENAKYTTNFDKDFQVALLEKYAKQLFTDIWSNLDEKERVLLIACALARSVETGDGESNVSSGENALEISDDGFGRLDNLSGLHGELISHGILRKSDSSLPQTFSVLFDAWLIENAMGSIVDDLHSVEDILKQPVDEERPTYVKTVEAAMPALFERLVDKAGNRAVVGPDRRRFARYLRLGFLSITNRGLCIYLDFSPSVL